MTVLTATLLWSQVFLGSAHAQDLEGVEETEPGAPVGQIAPAPGGGTTDPDPIINGQDADETIHPETGGLLLRLEESEQEGIFLMCSSTLIAPDVVLIAAHCVDPAAFCYEEIDGDGCIQEVGWSRKSNLSAWSAGATDWPDDVVMASDWIKNPTWDYYSLAYGLAANRDIALVFLEEAVTDVDPAVVVTADESTELAEGDEVTVVGWGYQTSDLTGELGVKEWGVSDISRMNSYEMQIGADFEAVRKCHGDSGGPTFRDFPDSGATVTERIIGVTSHTYDQTDCEETGGVDTRIDYYLSWIESEMVSRCRDGSRAWCDEEGIIQPYVPPKSLDDLKQDIHLVGCAAGPTRPALGLALVGLGLALSRRRRR